MAETFTRAQKAAAIARELGYRRRVYPRRVAEGKMTDGAAFVQIALMEAILADYEAPDPVVADLFGATR